MCGARAKKEKIGAAKDGQWQKNEQKYILELKVLIVIFQCKTRFGILRENNTKDEYLQYCVRCEGGGKKSPMHSISATHHHTPSSMTTPQGSLHF